MGKTPAPEQLFDIDIINDKYRKCAYLHQMPDSTLRQFDTIDKWYDYVKTLRIQPGQVLLPYVDAFDIALRALVMAYVLPEFCKLGEMKALATLEQALLGAYKHQMCQTKKDKHCCAKLFEILGWATKNHGLPVEWYRYVELPESRSKSPRRSCPSDLTAIRNRQMHGQHYQETLPWAGLFEFVKKIIEFAYKDSPPYDLERERLLFMNATTNDSGDWCGEMR